MKKILLMALAVVAMVGCEKEKIYTISTIPTTGGQVEVSVGKTAKEGANVTVTAKADEDYEFVEWIMEGVTLTLAEKELESVTFTMPANNVSVKANFKLIDGTGGAVLLETTDIDVLYIGLKGWTAHNHYVLQLSSNDYNESSKTGSKVSLYLDGFKTYFYDGINPDIYVYSETESGSTFSESKLMKSDDSKIVINGTETAISGGQVVISKNGTEFTITGKVNGSDGVKYEFEYKGNMPMTKARLNLNYAKGTYAGSYLYYNDEIGYKDVGMYDIVLSNLEGSFNTYFNGPGESLSFVFGGAYDDNGSYDPINYMQEFIPNGDYAFATGGIDDDESYGMNVIWPFTGDWWNEIQFITDDSKVSKNDMADSKFSVTVGAKDATKGYYHTITGEVLTDNGVEIEFLFEGYIKFGTRGNTMRPISILTSDYTLRPLTQSFFCDYEEQDNGVYGGELYFGTADSDPLNFDDNAGEFVLLYMFRPDESDFLPTGENHFSTSLFDEPTPMTIVRPYNDEIWDSSWLISKYLPSYIPIFGAEKISVSKNGTTYTINFELIDDAWPPHKIIGSYTGEILDWDDEPIYAPKRKPANYVEQRAQRTSAPKIVVRKGTKK